MNNEHIFELVKMYLLNKTIKMENIINEMHLINSLVRHKILNILYSDIYSQFSKQATIKLKVLNRLNKDNTNYKISVIKEILEIASKNSIQCLLIKGIALSKYIYNDIYARPGNDIDIWVQNDKAILLG